MYCDLLGGLKAKQDERHFLATCRTINVGLQVAIVYSPYYDLRAQQIFMLQIVDAVSTFCNMTICCARRS